MSFSPRNGSQDGSTEEENKVQQKEVVKPLEQFIKTDNRLLIFPSMPTFAYKRSKSMPFKNFALKTFIREHSCAYEKLSYDLLELFGVTVPKTYILKDAQGKQNVLAFQIKSEYLCLFYFIGGKVRETGKDFRINRKIKEESLSKQCVLASHAKNNQDKPIKGLYEHVAVFAYLRHTQPIGPTFQNIGLIEHDTYFQAIKINPSFCHLSSHHHLPNFEITKCLSSLTADNFESYFGDVGNNTDVFKHVKREQILDGMLRVVNVSDKQLRTVIYNERIPILTKTFRDDTYRLLIARRDGYREKLITLGLYQSLSIQPQAVLIQPPEEELALPKHPPLTERKASYWISFSLLSYSRAAKPAQKSVGWACMPTKSCSIM